MKKLVSASLIVGFALSVAGCSKTDTADNVAVANDVALLNDEDAVANLTAVDSTPGENGAALNATEPLANGADATQNAL